MADNVNHPKHYTQGKIEVIDFILDQKMGYLESNILKYICRYKYKNGLEDLKKARSEEHTLNSSHTVISYAVFCLKKKTLSNV